MRLNEICQLYCEDIKCNGRVWYFQLTDERDNQSLKNKQSKRLVPIHKKLIEMGFIDFVKEVKESKKDRLFYINFYFDADLNDEYYKNITWQINFIK